MVVFLLQSADLKKKNPPLTLGFLDIWAPSIVFNSVALFSSAFEIFLEGFLWVPIIPG